MGFAATIETSAFRVSLLIACAAVLALTGVWWHDSRPLTFVGCSLGLLLLAAAYRFDYLHPSVPYLVPWLTVLVFSVAGISEYSRNLQLWTSSFLFGAILAWLLATASSPVFPERTAKSAQPHEDSVDEQLSLRSLRGVVVGFGVLYLLAAFNVAHAGYVPLISLLTTGNSRYFTFGIPSVYGAFLAYANAMACLAFYVYLRTGIRLCLVLVISVLAIHVLFVTRQNVVTLLVEIFVIRSVAHKRFSRTVIIAAVAIGLVAFSALGNLRSGSIRNALGVTAAYAWLPNSVLWVYAYSYFNVLNLENMMTLSSAPYYDGSMWDSLLPSVLRPDIDYGSFQQIAVAGVSSYIYPIYLDVGPIGVVVATAILGLVTTSAYRRALRAKRFLEVGTYACLYSCALLSFFVDFWLYLPVIFQLFFFWAFHRLLLRRSARRSAVAT